MVGAAAVLAGCAGVTGTAIPAPEPVRVATPLADLMVPPSAFPPQFPAAVVLPPAAVAQAAADLTGIPDGARVDPPGCRPPVTDRGPDGTVIAVGRRDDAHATLTVELARTDRALDALRDQLEQCPQVSAVRDELGHIGSTVHTEILSAPSVDTDDTLALRRTVDSGDHLGTLRQSLLTLVAQHGDVRISATLMSFGDAANGTETDTVATVALDALFTTAADRVRAG